MPELAEVAFYSKKWAPGLGDRVVEVICRDRARIYRTAEPGKIRQGLKGKKLTGIETKGKQMRFVFEEASLGLHLGMTGKLLVKGKEHEAGKHDHLVIRQMKCSLVFRDARMFGALKFAADAEPDWWVKLPPEVVSRAFTLKVVTEYLLRRKGSPLKAVLLQQERFPGVGNWMADEILWRCRLHPGRRAGTLDEGEAEVFLSGDKTALPRCAEDHRDEIRASPSLLVIPPSLASRRQMSARWSYSRARDDRRKNDGLVSEVSGEVTCGV